jgi:hypothetical protein
MQPLYIFIFGAIGVIIAIGVGLELSKGLEDFVVYLLFWLLYIVTIATFINIIMVVNYYLTMKDKTGVPGVQGELGDAGDSGDTGLCDPTCRDSICEEQILEMINGELTKRVKDTSTFRFNNIYIKSKIRQMCSSDEFKQLSPYNGPYNLINYIKDIWKIWFDSLYEAGGSKYFETISAENEFDWLSENPYFEIKKYDLFYWGMGKQYRPQVNNKCYDSLDGNTPDLNSSGSILRVSKTTLYDSLGNDSGSGATNNVSFWRPRQFTYKGAVYYPIGDLAIGPNRANENIKTVKHVGQIRFPLASRGPFRETILISGDVKGPIDYNLVWTNNKFWIWRPIAPKNYLSLGDVVTFNANPPLTGEQAPTRCVFNDLTIRVPPNGNVLWSSYGAPTSINTLILGFTPNNGSYVGSSKSNCYNMFRAVVGLNVNSIPESDINGSFYQLDETKYDTNFTIGVDYGSPPLNKDSNKVGKGYINFPQKDSKYSILPYLNLKNNAVLNHKMTNTNINATLILNAISNAYLLNIGDETNKKCLNFDGKTVTIASCDEEISSQTFSIIFTGNKKNECKLQHYESKKIIKFKNGLYTLVNNDEQTDIEYQMFIMT